MFTKKQLALLYEISTPTFKKLIAPLNFPNNQRLFSPLEVLQIFKLLGVPEKMRRNGQLSFNGTSYDDLKS